jgi:hypothetical protein
LHFPNACPTRVGGRLCNAYLNEPAASRRSADARLELDVHRLARAIENLSNVGGFEDRRLMTASPTEVNVTTSCARQLSMPAHTGSPATRPPTERSKRAPPRPGLARAPIVPARSSLRRLAEFATPAGLVLLCAAWILPTLVGHDPWKPDDAYPFGLVPDQLQRGDWVVPVLVGEPFSRSGRRSSLSRAVSPDA